MGWGDEGWFKKFSLAVLIGFAVISFWRGVWQLMDIYLLPSNPTASYVISIILGLVILVFTHKTIKELM